MIPSSPHHSHPSNHPNIHQGAPTGRCPPRTKEPQGASGEKWPWIAWKFLGIHHVLQGNPAFWGRCPGMSWGNLAIFGRKCGRICHQELTICSGNQPPFEESLILSWNWYLFMDVKLFNDFFCKFTNENETFFTSWKVNG